MQQIREEYDKDKLQELADRIECTAEGLDLVHPMTVARFDDKGSLEQFLRDHARFYQYEHDDVLLDMMPSHEGAWHIRVSGHRRARALLLKCQQLGLDPTHLNVACTVQRNPTFDEARHSQIVENTSDHIKESEDAREVQREYCYRYGEMPSVLIDRETELSRLREIADYLGYSVEKVEGRLLYASMPLEITQYESRGLSYTNVVQLARLRRVWARQCGPDGEYKMTVEQAHQKMHDYFQVSLLHLLRGRKSTHTTTALDAKIREVRGEAAYYTDELFWIDTQKEEAAGRERVRRGIAEAATLALSGGLASPDRCEREAAANRIRALIAALRDAEDRGDVASTADHPAEALF